MRAIGDCSFLVEKKYLISNLNQLRSCYDRIMAEKHNTRFLLIHE